MTDNQSYNGWKNYETWVAALWIDNEEGSYNEARETVLAYGLGVNEIANALKNWAEEVYMDPVTEEIPASLATDLLRSAWEEIDWVEVARHYMMDELEESGIA